MSLFKSYLAHHFFPGQNAEESIIGCIKILSLLFLANGNRKLLKLPIGDFYVQELCQGLNFKTEYKNWRDSETSQRFSYFNYPFLFDPISKTKILRLDALYQMSEEFEQSYVSQALIAHAQKFLEHSEVLDDLETRMKLAANPFLVLEIRRESLVEDSLEQLGKKVLDLKKPIRIKFIGGGEEGMDQGGVQKEYFQVIINRLLNPDHGLFTYEEESRYSWISRSSMEPDSHFELVGMILGLSIYNGVILGISFPPVLYKKLKGEPIKFQDFAESFPALGNGLQQLLDWTDGDVEDIFQRSFEITYSDYGQVRTVPLVEGGESIMVTNDNRKGILFKS